ncbi:MAG: hypothetical protein M1331_00035 [Candidatus Marsarchaeota archaeon]|nr:hypothetical protein [Candidatus Marsarchaeota archaeon]
MQDQNQTTSKRNENIKEFFKVAGAAVGISLSAVAVSVLLHRHIKPPLAASLRTGHVLRQIKSEKNEIKDNKEEIAKDSKNITRLYSKINKEIKAEKNDGIKFNINKPSYGLSFKFNFKDMDALSSDYISIKKNLGRISLLRKDIRARKNANEIISAKIQANEYFIYKKALILNRRAEKTKQ